MKTIIDNERYYRGQTVDSRGDIGTPAINAAEKFDNGAHKRQFKRNFKAAMTDYLGEQAKEEYSGDSVDSGDSGDQIEENVETVLNHYSTNALIQAAFNHFIDEVSLDDLGLSEVQKNLLTEFGNSIIEAFYLGKFLNIDGYISNVETDGPWDYKNTDEYRDLEGIEQFGNFAFGVTSASWANGATRGISTIFESFTANMAIRGGGYYQEHYQPNVYDESNGNWNDLILLTPDSRFGENPGDGPRIMEGHMFYNQFNSKEN